jgi:hypothetical protein
MVSTKDLRKVPYVCQNPACRRSFEVTDPPSHVSGQKVRCRCGSLAKRIYEAPAVRKLSPKC